MYTVEESYTRFDQKNNMVNRPFWDPSLKHILPTFHEVQIRNIERGVNGLGLKDFALSTSASTLATTLGTDINRPNSGLTSWKPLPISSFVTFPEKKPALSDAPSVTRLIKRAARFFGADMVGVARLDMRWVYSKHYIRETKESLPVDIDSSQYPNVIVMALEMNYGAFGTAPSAVHAAETYRAYSRMAFLTSSLAQFIRLLGFKAIPALNDTALSVPLAIDAGLGELSRMGLLIGHWFGPRQRLCKVITDLPLVPDQPVELGVTQFCTVCGKCARACPGRAISPGDRTTKSDDISNNGGVLKWPLNAVKCREYWCKVGTNCGVCIRVCPFNKGHGGIHKMTRWLIQHVPAVDSTLVRLDDLFGYGKQVNPELFWSGKV